jgi:hypothetical protein
MPRRDSRRRSELSPLLEHPLTVPLRDGNGQNHHVSRALMATIEICTQLMSTAGFLR